MQQVWHQHGGSCLPAHGSYDAPCLWPIVWSLHACAMNTSLGLLHITHGLQAATCSVLLKHSCADCHVNTGTTCMSHRWGRRRAGRCWTCARILAQQLRQPAAGCMQSHGAAAVLLLHLGQGSPVRPQARRVLLLLTELRCADESPMLQQWTTKAYRVLQRGYELGATVACFVSAHSFSELSITYFPHLYATTVPFIPLFKRCEGRGGCTCRSAWAPQRFLRQNSSLPCWRYCSIWVNLRC